MTLRPTIIPIFGHIPISNNAQAVLRNAHPRLRQKRQLLTSETKSEPAKEKVEYD
jgi:hypothetical protein